MAGVLIWTAYVGWIALFARIAWRGRVRLLLGVGAAMIACFAVSWVYVDTAISELDRDRSGDFAYGMAMIAAIAVFIVPLGVAAIAYPIGRAWAR